MKNVMIINKLPLFENFDSEMYQEMMDISNESSHMYEQPFSEEGYEEEDDIREGGMYEQPFSEENEYEYNMVEMERDMSEMGSAEFMEKYGKSKHEMKYERANSYMESKNKLARRRKAIIERRKKSRR